MGFELPANVENLTLLGAGNISGFGNALDNNITGNTGNNNLDGGVGADTMAGGVGNDSYFVDSSFDLANENVAEGTDTVFASASFGLGANVENLTLTGAGSINGSGNALVNQITGNTGNNVLNGDGGADTLIGGLGDDTYGVDSSFENVIENPGEGTDTVLATMAWPPTSRPQANGGQHHGSGSRWSTSSRRQQLNAIDGSAAADS